MSLQDRLADSLEKVHWHGHYYSALCPWHDNRNTPAMLVYPDAYHCTSCGATGPLEMLDKKLHGVSSAGRIHIDAPRILPRWKNWMKRYENISDLAIAAHAHLQKYPDDKFFFKKRKIDQFIDEGMFGFLDGWLLFPVFDRDHKIIDIVVRAGPGKSDHVKYVLLPVAESNSRSLYVPNWDQVIKSDEIYVVYGIIDSWALHSIGLPVITGITGKSLDADEVKRMHKLVTIIPDRYEDGEAHKLGYELGWMGKVLRMKWPDENVKDCDDIRMKYGQKKLKNLIIGA